MRFLKWFLLIFSAVFFANIASYYATTALNLKAAQVVIEALKPQPAKPATVRVANPLKPGQSRKEALCSSWQALYRDEPKTSYRLQMEQACKSVYGEQWTYEPPDN